MIRSDDDSWLQESGPVRSRMLASLQTLLMPALNVGQPAEMLDLIEITEKDVEKYNEDIPWAVIRANWEPHLEEDLRRKKGQHSNASDEEWAGIEQLFKNVCPHRESINYLSLKQYRGTEWTDKACYQALVLLQKKIETIYDIREIHRNMHVKIHQYPTMPIVNTLGLKVKATDSKGHFDRRLSRTDSSVFYAAYPCAMNWGIKICSRINSMEWSADGEDPDRHTPDGLDDNERDLLEMVSVAKGQLSNICCRTSMAHTIPLTIRMRKGSRFSCVAALA